MRHINIYNTTEEYNAAKIELYDLEHFVAYNKETNNILTKDAVDITFNITPEDATISYSIDNENYERTTTNDVIIKIPRGSTIYYKIEREGYVSVTNNYLAANSNMINISLQEEFNAEIGDIVVYKDNKFYFIKSDELTNTGTPIGIVVIPSSHNVYGDDSCGIMSLTYMNCSTPTLGGTSEQRMYWGNTVDIESLVNNSVCCYIGNQVLYDEVKGTTPGGVFLPSDKFDILQCPHDEDAYYSISPTSSTYYAPSPYLTNNQRNTMYYQITPPSSSNNALADFNGKDNTNKIITKRGTKDYTSWKPTYNNGADYPAASCCNMFYTEGTQQGDWYLPSLGELCYILPTFNKINETITNTINVYGGSISVMSDTDGYWSSSEASHNGTNCLSVNTGQAFSKVKAFSSQVRAFLRINSKGVIRNN